MRAQLTVVLLLGLSAVAGAQTSAPPAGAVPQLPTIGLPLPTIGLPHPAMGLPPPPAPSKAGDHRQQRRGDSGHRGSRQLPAAIYIFPTIGDPVGPVVGDAADALDPAAVGGRLRVEVSPAVVGQVYLDGYYVGTTEDLSRAMDVTSGRHSIEIRADGYQAAQDELAVAAGRSVTYRGLLTATPEPPPASTASAPPAAEAAGPTTFYVIPGCYVGNVPPEEKTVPAGCDPGRAIVVTH